MTLKDIGIYSSTFFLPWGHPDAAGIFKAVLFSFFLLEASAHVFPVCGGLDLLNQFPCWWAHLFVFEAQAVGYIFYLFHQLY